MYYCVNSVKYNDNRRELYKVEMVTENKKLALFFHEISKRDYSMQKQLILDSEFVEIDCADYASLVEHLNGLNPEISLSLYQVVEPIVKLILINNVGGMRWYVEVDDDYYFDTEYAVYASYVHSLTFDTQVERVESTLADYISLDLPLDTLRSILKSSGINPINTERV